jgi:hypothetical protein
MPTPWHHTPAALDLIAVLFCTSLPVENRSHTYVITRDEWQAFTGPLYAQLEAAWRAFEPSDIHPRDVAAAVTGQRLRGVHFIDDEPRLLALRDELAAVVVLRTMGEAA